MSAIDHTIVITDNRDGCTYERRYVVHTGDDWSSDVYDLLSYVLPDVYPLFSHPRTRVGGNSASGPLFVWDAESNRNVVVGMFRTTVNL